MSFEHDASEHTTSMPPHVRACVTLFSSRESTAHGRAYTLEQDDLVWVYMFFEMFAVVVLTTKGEGHLAPSEAYALSWQGFFQVIRVLDSILEWRHG
jgi:predicted acyltransferase